MIVFTNGCFDLLHVGHLETLRYAYEISKHGPPTERQGVRTMNITWPCRYPNGELIVGINSDDSIRFLKGSHRPIINQWDRKEMLESLKFVDQVIIFDELTPYELIKKISPDIIVKGGDYSSSKNEVVGADLAKVLIAPFKTGVSTSKIIDRIKSLEEKREATSSNR